MSGLRRLEERNAAIAELMTDSEKLKNFYRFAALNPHIELHEVCQIVINRQSAGICFSFEEWNAMGRRIARGSKGIPYYDRDGNKLFAFDEKDTYGDNGYKREHLKIERLLVGLDVLNDTNLVGNERGSYRKIHTGVGEYLKENGILTDDIIRNRLLIEGITFSLYSKMDLKLDSIPVLTPMPYSLNENADLFKEINALSSSLVQESEEAFRRKQQVINLIDDTEEQAVTDEVTLTQNIEKEKNIYERYLKAQQEYPHAVVVIRLGDFYEVMGENAIKIASELDFILTGRDLGLSERIPMCGFPYHAKEKYIDKILEIIAS